MRDYTQPPAIEAPTIDFIRPRRDERRASFRVFNYTTSWYLRPPAHREGCRCPSCLDRRDFTGVEIVNAKSL